MKQRSRRSQFFLDHKHDRDCRACWKPTWSPRWGQHGGDPDRQATIDHIVPLARGGAKNDPKNWQLFCRKCNQEKGCIPDEIWQLPWYHPKRLITEKK